MSNLAPASSPEEFQVLYGIEPTMLENLLMSQEAYAKKGHQMTLEEIYVMEIGDLPEFWDEDEEE